VIPNRFIPPINLDLISSTVITETVGGVVDITITMIDSITAFNAVTSDGLQANSNTVSHRDKIAGIVLTNIAAGFSGSCRIEGEVFNPAWTWTAGDKIYLNGTSLSTTSPSTGFTQRLAIAKDTFTIILKPNPSIRI